MATTFRDYINQKKDTYFLKEGGVAGHMAHLYDNRDLTFTKLKEILSAASEGQIEGTEKTDGQNLFISYSVKDGKAKAARNKGNIKNGGMDAQQLATKFEGRGALEKAFVDAFSVFERAVRSLSPQQQEKIFGPDAEIFYNAEIMDPRSPNVINYDKKTLLIHQVGHAYFNRETGNIVDVDVKANADALDRALSIMQDAIQDEDYSIIKNAVRQLERLDDDVALGQALTNIEAFQNRYGLSDDNTINDYLIEYIGKYLEKVFPTGTLPLDVKNKLVNKILGVKGLNITQIAKDLPPEAKAIAGQINKEAGNIIKRAIYPLEDIVHDFTVEMLKGLQSAFVIDNSKEVKRLRAEVQKAINAIQNSNNEIAHEVLKQQLKKLKKIENVSSAAEGFVFDYDGQTYKFTGNFAPTNQLLGLFKYGRAGVKPEEFI